MQVNASFANLETMSWSINNSADVNPTLADRFLVIPWKGGMTTAVVGEAYAGALARVPDLPLVDYADTFCLLYKMRPSQAAIVLGQAFEFDLMISGPDGFVYNASCQMNNAEGGMWQIAKSNGDWVDTGIVAPVQPDVWTPVVVTFKINWTARTISCQSITVGGVTNPVPLALQNVAPQNLKWGPKVIVVQRQLDLNSRGGAYSMDDADITLTQSA